MKKDGDRSTSLCTLNDRLGERIDDVDDFAISLRMEKVFYKCYTSTFPRQFPLNMLYFIVNVSNKLFD